MKLSFWQEKKYLQIAGLNAKANNIEKNGIEGLDRVLRSNKLTPQEITDYAEILLKGRLEAILGIEGERKFYDDIKERYPQIIGLANQYYDLVIVDLDHEIGMELEAQILKSSDIVVAMVSQRAKKIQKIMELIKQGEMLNDNKTILTIGKYMEDTKYNAKNITRNILKRKQLINTIPYNNLFFEVSQEGRALDLFYNLLKIKEKDVNYKFVSEIRRLYDTVQAKLDMLKMQAYK